jgi:hypothetical protein
MFKELCTYTFQLDVCITGACLLKVNRRKYKYHEIAEVQNETFIFSMT